VRVAATIVYVADVPAALAFYAEAFGLEPGFLAPDGDYATLAGEGRGRPAGFEVWVEADDVPAALARALGAGAELVQEPVVKPWGQTVAYVRGPDGVLIELGTPVP
jgi:catechol 2,3-dioxygenase-like lactoylglutathione lyase family enzyme